MRARRASAAEGRHDDANLLPVDGPRHALREPPANRPGPWPWWSLPDRLRPRSVRAKIIALLMVPVVSLMALWAFATVTTAQSVSNLTQFKELDATLLDPVSTYVTAVQAERSAAARYLAHPDPTRLDTLDARARSTENAAAALRRGIEAGSTDTAALSPELLSRTRHLTDATMGLPTLRKRVTAKKISWDEAFAGYGDTIDRGFSVDGALSRVSSSVAGQGPDVGSQARVVLELSRAREMIAREDAIVGGFQADGEMSTERYRAFVGAVQSRRTLFQSAVDDLRPSDESAYRAVLDGRPYHELGTLERTIEDAGPGRTARPATMTAWDYLTGSVLHGMDEAQAGASTAAVRKADPFALDVLGTSGVAAVLGLVGVLVSLLISMQVGRGLITELVGLRNSALELAGSKLPQSLRRLHAGEEVDIDDEAPVERRGGDEIGQVGQALNAVHRAALQAAVERAEVLSGISGVYVKLARRSQLLLHRQLSLLDSMERRIEDPADLEDLFRLDHLTTRMRRHAENLIVLSGAAPVRGWRRPVPVLDVVRAAVAEVEDFTRVEVRVAKDVRVAGSAVADLTHLIAELVENAVAFSPPHTKVQVRGEGVGSGLALEVEDRGLGMSRAALAQANRKIADASQVDLLDTDRLGLYVVNRLAHRRGVQVALQRSVYGGVTAVVLIPETLLEQAAPANRDDAEHGRHALTTVEPPAIPGQRGNHRPRRPARTRAAIPPRPLTDTDREGDPASPADAGTDRTAQSGGPARPAPVRPPALPPRPRSAPRSEPADSAQPGGQPRPEPADRSRKGSAAPARELSAPSREGPAARPAGRPATGGEPAADPASAPAPLPQRVRQASIAPQLRDTTARSPRAVPHIADPAATERSPERARATMAALRRGWLSGSQAEENRADRNRRGDDLAPRNADRTAEADRTADAGRTAGGDRPRRPARGPSHSETPSQGDET